MDADLNTIFIGGPAHSGTSLLEFLLYHHPRIQQTANFRTMRENSLDMFRSIYTFQTYVKNNKYENNSKYLLFKNPDNINLVETILDISPTAKVILIYRDPCDTVLSLLRRGFHSTFQEGLEYWIKKYEIILKFKKQPHKSVYILNYEKFCDNPKNTLKEVCDFLGLSDESEEMLEKHSNHCRMHHVSRRPADENREHLKLRQYQLASPIKRAISLKHKMSDEQRHIFNKLTQHIENFEFNLGMK